MLETPVFFENSAVVLDPRGLVAGRALKELFVLLAFDLASQDARRCRWFPAWPLERVRMHTETVAYRVAAEVQIEAVEGLRKPPLQERIFCRRYFRDKTHLISPSENASSVLSEKECWPQCGQQKQLFQHLP
jgi:hypothetical protein